jgi:hypothetical protein
MRLGMGLGLGNLLSGQPITGMSNKYSFNFDGSNDYLELNGTLESVFQGAFTISAWIKPDDGQPSGVNALFGSDSTSDQDRFRVMVKTDGKIGLLYRSNAGSAIDADSTSAVFSDGATDWTHIAVTLSQSGGTVTGTIYINGSSIAGSFSSSQTMADFATTTNFAIGGANRAGSLTQYFDGLIDEVAVWNAELSASDVAKIASKPVDFSKASTYATDRTSNLKLWLRAGDKALPEEDASIARQDFYTDFDGADDYIEVADNDDLSFGDGSSDSPFSISAWINPVDSTQFQVLGKLNEWQLYLGSDDKLILFLQGATGSDYEYASDSGSAISQNVWTHVACTYNGVGGTSANAGIKLYVNGIESSLTLGGAGTYDAMENTTNPVRIGNYSSQYAEGKISNVTLYKTELDAQTIKQFAKSRFTPMRDNRFSVVDFDGSNDYILIGDSSDLAFADGQAFSVSMWFKTSTSSEMYLFDNRSSNIGFTAIINASGTNYLGYVTDGSSNAGFTNTVDYDDGQWHHFAFTWDGTDTITSYIDGSSVGTATQALGAIDGGDLYIGKPSGSNNKYFNGQMSSISIYNEEKDIYAIYQQGITYDESSLSGLVGYWRMGDDTSKAYPTIADSSSNSNDGTITNGASDDIVQQMVAGYDLGSFESSSEELGAEIITNGDYSNGTTGWSIGAGGTADTSSGAVVYTYSGSGNNFVKQELIPAKNGALYKAVFTLTESGGSAYYGYWDGTNLSSSVINLDTGQKTYTQYFTATSTSITIRFVSGNSNGNSITVDNVSVKEVLQSEVSDTYPTIIDVNEPVLGVELITNGDFASDANWTKGDGWTISSGVATSDPSAQSATSYLKSASFTALSTSKKYRLSYTVVRNAGTIDFIGVGGSDTGLTHRTASGTYFEDFVPSGANTQIWVVSGDGGFNGTIDNISLKEIFGHVGTMTNQDSADLVYSSVLPDQSFLTGVNSAYNFVSLDGTNDYIKNESYTAHQQDTGTISIWVKFDHVSGRQLIVGAGGTSDTGTNRAIGLADDDVKFFGAAADGVIGANVVADNWYHIVLTWNGTSVIVYVDGISYSQTQSALVTPTGTKFVIGSAPWDFSSKTDGDFGTVAHWNKILTSTEVNAIKDLGRHGNLLDSYSDNLKLCYSMSGLDAKTGLTDTTTTIFDRSGNSNHGTPVSIASSDLKSSPNAEPNGYAKGDTNRSTTTP